MQMLYNESYFVLVLLLDSPVPFFTPLGVQIHNHSIILTKLFLYFSSGEKEK